MNWGNDDLRLREARTRDLLDVKDSILRIHGSLVLRGLTNQALLVGKRDEGGSSVATLLVGN